MRLPCAPSCALKHLRTPLGFLRNAPRRSLHDAPQPFDAAVIGAGITGLTAAYRLSKDPSCSKVTLYEKSHHVGGWLQSETINVDGGEIVFEYGPRTLRAAAPSCLPLLDLLLDLNLGDQVLFTDNSSPASQSRYIYYPDHLVRLPTIDRKAGLISGIWNLLYPLLREPVFRTLLWSFCTEPLKDGRKSEADESVADFVSRRLSPEVADNLVSSMFHGIFGGDIDRLSATAVMYIYRELEKRDERVMMSFLQAQRAGKQYIQTNDLLALVPIIEEKSNAHTKLLSRLVENNSTLTLKKGVGQLADALLAELKRSRKVEVLADSEVKSIHQNPDTSNLRIEDGNGHSRVHSRLIATNSPADLANQLRRGLPEDAKVPQDTLSMLETNNYAVTMMVVNLYYPNPHLLPIRGFGYLIPRSVPFEENPERALGVIFASETGQGQDSAPGTKLTVMMGGHWWDGWKESDYPDHDTAVHMAQSLLKRHLNITDSPTVARTRLQRDAIPQPTVGHIGRLNKLSRSIKNDFMNRITLAGAWYALGGTGVVDSVRQAYIATAFGLGSKFSEDLKKGGGIIRPPTLWGRSSLDFLSRYF
ncbi:oxygen-dependent protoporphyrinogen oxidase [Aspergillus lucknowensis]|uniref:Protoporphyrinogen oxidase n=1 Tax=Aspergillus lucknowensis TaxID=176173 RepID=A0ABR4M2G6_9EURO